MHVAFFGTADFAVPTLKSVHRAGHEVDPVVTSPPKPSGRGRKLRPSPVETAAGGLGLRVLRPENPGEPEFVEIIRDFKPDVAVLAAYGFILRQPLLDLPRLGFYNLHPSLLPRYRGAAPIQRALMDGQTQTGVSVIAMSRAVDSGDIVSQRNVEVGPDETAGELSARLADAGARLMVEVLRAVETDSVERVPQDDAAATLAPKIAKDDRNINWSLPARVIHNRIRALSPEPGAAAAFRGRRLVLLRSHVLAAGGPHEPGLLLSDLSGLAVGTGSGVLQILKVKPEGGKTQTGQAFRNGHHPATGERLTSP